jgi:glycosyltransferase involved in cell wall biosynthesis
VKPVLFVTGNAPAYRVGAFARLHEREGIELALFGGSSLHGGSAFEGELPFPHRDVTQRELYRLAAGGDYRAVIVSTAGRLAPLAGWAGARRAGVPLILWTSLWAHPRTAAHLLGYVAVRRLYGSADAVVTYGPHVSAYVSARGARNVHVAPQSVDNDFWRAPRAHAREAVEPAATTFLFVGRASREKGAEVLLEAWRASGLAPPHARLVLVGSHHGADPDATRPARDGGGSGVEYLPALTPVELRDVYAAADVLVVPSIRTAAFREPWGLVVNEAMNRGLAVVSSDAVGAAAGGLVRHGSNGLIVAAGDSERLAAALSCLATDETLRASMGAAGRADVLAYDHDAWAAGFSQALATVIVSRGRW